MGRRRLTTKEFISKAEEIHGKRYGYDKTNYTLSKNKVKIKCDKHGYFEQKAGSHLKGQGCKKCGLESMAKKETKTTKEFILDAKEIHGDRYNYDEVNYTHCEEKVKIKCKEHGFFKQRAGTHLEGGNCPKCARDLISKKLSNGKVKFIKQARKVHGSKYKYNEVNYTSCKRKIKIWCPIHGYFYQKPSSHLLGRGCPQCGQVGGWNADSWFKYASESNNFDSFKIYIVKSHDIDGTMFYKIGRTYTSISYRFREFPYKYQIEKLIELDEKTKKAAEYIYNLEAEIHLFCNGENYKPKKEFKGKTECYTGLDISKIMELNKGL